MHRPPPKIKRSLRTRLLAGYALVLLASMLILSAYFYLQVRRQLTDAMREFLRSEFIDTVSLISKEAQDPASMSNFLSRRTLLAEGPYRLQYALFDHEKHMIARTEGFSEDAGAVDIYDSHDADQNRPLFYEHTLRTAGGRKMYMMTQSFVDGAGKVYYLQLALGEAEVDKTMRAFVRTIAEAVPVVLVLALLGGIFLTRRMLEPIGKLSRAARELSLTDLDRELPVSGSGDELDELAHAFNDVFKKLRDAYQRIIRFTADASHELRLPITAIKGEAEIVLGRERDLEEYRRVLANIIEEFDRLSRMVGQLLTLTRADSGEDRLEEKPVDLADLMRKLVEFYEPLAEEKNITIHFEKTGVLTVLGDSGRLQELFSNLIDNALKYTPSGGRVNIEVMDGESECRVVISDTGIGISEDDQKKVFERFFRADKARTRDQGGVGLGLSIADTIARAHRGSITLVSESGKGSTFTVTLPKYFAPSV